MNGWSEWILKILIVSCCINTACADVRICPYYDNRKCAVVWVGDDLADGNIPFFAQDVKAAESNKIVYTAAVMLFGMSNGWNTVQQWYTNGAFSIASHSVTHMYLSPWADVQDIEYEVSASQSEIIQRLDLPAWNKYKGRQFMTAWVQPSGTAPGSQESEFRRQLGLNYYLSDRQTGTGFAVSWDVTNGLFSRIGSSGYATLTATQNNSAFDQNYNSGQVYLIYNHPAAGYPVTNGSALEAHMKYIGGRKDVWYSGFEYVYTYKYLQSINPPQITISTSDTQRVVFQSVADSVARSKYGLSYPLTYRVDIPTNWTGVYVFYSDAGNPVPQQMISKTTNDFFNGLNVFRQDIGQHVVYISQAFPEYHDAFQIMILNADGDADGDGIPNRLEPNGTDMLIPK